MRTYKEFIYPAVAVLLLASCAATGKARLNSNDNEDPSEISDQPNWTAMHYYSLAETAIQNGDYDSAVNLLEKAEEEDPEDVYLKEVLIQTLAKKAYSDSTVHERIIALATEYYELDLYNSSIMRQLAESHRIRGNISQAEKYLTIALEMEPSMHLYLAYYFFKKSYKEETDLLLLDKALEYPLTSPLDVINLSGQLKNVDPEKNILLLESAYEKWNDERTLTLLLQAYDDNGQTDLITDIISSRLEAGDPVGENLKIYLLASYFTTGNYWKIIENKDLCLELNSEEALRFLFISALNLDDHDLIIESGTVLENIPGLAEEFKPILHGYLGYSYYVEDDFSRAAEQLQKDLPQDLLMEVYQNFVARGEEDNYAKLQEFAEFSVEVSDKPELANFMAGYALGLADLPGQAEKYLQAVPDLYLKQNNLLLTAALTYMDSFNDTLKARSLLDLRDEKDPSAEEVFAVYYYNVETDSLAYYYFRKVIANEPKPDMEIFLLASLLSEKLNDLEDFLPELEKSVSLYPENPEILNMVGYTIANNDFTGKFPLAEHLLLKALDLVPDNAMIWDSLAWLYFKQGKIEEAVNAMATPLSQEIDNSEIAYHLGEIYLKLGKREKAVEYLNLAIELDNDPDSVELSRQILETLEE